MHRTADNPSASLRCRTVQFKRSSDSLLTLMPENCTEASPLWLANCSSAFTARQCTAIHPSALILISPHRVSCDGSCVIARMHHLIYHAYYTMRTMLVVRKDVSVLSSAEHAGPIFGRVMTKTENVSRSEATNYQQQQRQRAVRTDMHG